ncbi:MAG: spermine/spermidine synthase domain-containing protein [Myxococcaceae bacterium]
MSAPERAEVMRRRLILAFLFLSGATGLVYELVWSKYLSNLLGNSGQAHAVVLATFMGGLALGAYAFGRTADRVKSPLRLYGLLELAVGLYALAFRPVLDVLGGVYLAIAPLVPESARLGPKLLLAAASLIIPTMLMGGTLPALVRHFTSGLGSMRRELSRLYAVNSIGAAFGVFLAGVRLAPNFGLSASTRMAAAVNLILALSAIALSLRREGPAPAPASEEPEQVYPQRAVRAALVCVAASGFTAMLFEVTWIRLLTIVLGSSAYAFTLILTAFILGIGLGSFWLMTRRTERDTLRLFGWLQVCLVVAVCAALPLYVRLPHYFWVAHHTLRRSVEAWPAYQALTFFFCCTVLVVPTFFMGASFPAAARVATARMSELGRQLGGVYLWNTVGTISGAALGGLVLLPLLGLEGNFTVGIVITVAAAALALGLAPTGAASLPRRLWPAGLALGCAVVYVTASWGWTGFIANADAFRQRDKPYGSHAEYRAALDRAFETLFIQHDTFATVLVGRGRSTEHQFMRINGKVDASNGSDSETQVLAGHIGLLLAKREVKKVLLIGSGAAITAGAILTHDVERVDLVEISPAVMEGAKLFARDNRNALDDPRLHVHIDDAKTFMALSKVKYDLVVSVPSNPWVAGVSGLFSQDFFKIVAEHLEPDGLIVQWVHTYESVDEIVKLVVRTFRHATAWLGPQDLLFVGGRRPLAIDPSRIEARLARPGVREDLARCDAGDVVSLLARQVHGEEGLALFAGDGLLNTDDLNVLEYAAPIAFFIDKPPFAVGDERRLAGGGGLAIEGYLREHPLTPESAQSITKALSRYPKSNASLMRSIEERWVALAPGSPEAVLALARTALVQDDYLATTAVARPRLAAGDRSPDLVSVFLRARTRQVRLSRAAWNPVPLDEELRYGEEARAAHPGHPGLAASFEEFCTLFTPGACGLPAP